MRGTLQAQGASWLATPFVGLSVLLGVWGFEPMLEWGAWVSTTATLFLVTVTAVSLVRWKFRSRLLPTVAGILVATATSLLMFAKDTEGASVTLTDPAVFGALGNAITDGILQAQTNAAPVATSNGLVALLSVAFIGIFLLAEHIAVSWRAVASAGILILFPWISATFYQQRITTFALVAALTCWIAVMAIVRPVSVGERGMTVTGGVSATLAAVIATAFIVPGAQGQAGWGALPRFDTPESLDNGATRLNLALDLRSSITTNSRTPVMVYVTSGPKIETFKLYTLTDFDGSAWSRDEPVISERVAGAGLLWPEQVPTWSEDSKQRIDIAVLSLAEDNLPMPPAPRTVDVSGPWFYNPDLDEVVGDGANTLNLQYTVVTNPKYNTKNSLVATESLLTTSPTSDIDEARYLDVSPTIDLARVRGEALTVTEGATTRYAKAIAIQQYLRNPDEFTYDTTVVPSGADSVSAFLDVKSGYCVQFSTAMVVMLRSLDIPARLSVGFLSGDRNGDDEYIIRGKDAHAWPEVYFPEHGWVRFEPTPAVQTGSPPVWADPFAGAVPVPQDVLNGGSSQEPSTPIVETPTTGGNDGTPDVAPTVVVWPLVLGGIVLVLAALAWLFLRWKRRYGVAPTGPEAAWSRLSRELEPHLSVPRTLTPAEARVHLLTSLKRLSGAPSPDALREAMDALTNTLVQHRYLPYGNNVDQQVLDAWVDEIVSGVKSVASESKSSR